MAVSPGLLRAMQGQDELGVIIRIHLYVERQLEQFVYICLPNPEELGDRLSYSARVRLALACGLSANLKSPLNALGGLRNKLAHRAEIELTDDDLDRLQESFGVDFKYNPFEPAYVIDARRKRLMECLWNIWTAVQAEIRAAEFRREFPDSGLPQSN